MKRNITTPENKVLTRETLIALIDWFGASSEARQLVLDDYDSFGDSPPESIKELLITINTNTTELPDGVSRDDAVEWDREYAFFDVKTVLLYF